MAAGFSKYLAKLMEKSRSLSHLGLNSVPCQGFIGTKPKVSSGSSMSDQHDAWIHRRLHPINTIYDKQCSRQQPILALYHSLKITPHVTLSLYRYSQASNISSMACCISFPAISMACSGVEVSDFGQFHSQFQAGKTAMARDCWVSGSVDRLPSG